MYPKLDSPKTYEAALASLIKKWSARGRLDQIEAQGVTLADLRGRRQEFSRVLADTIRRGSFRYSALTPTTATIEGKVRQLYRPNLVDAVVLAVTAKYMAAVAEANLSPALHSFRKGRSSSAVVRLVAQYFNQYRARVPVKERGLYVLQRDITSYGESIDNSPSSALFVQVDRALRNDPDPKRRELARKLICEAILQPILGHDGAEKPLECGVPTGSPIQPVCANLYLTNLDARLDSVPGAFYSRFGDDILFIHPELETCEWADAEIQGQLAISKLSSKPEKQRNLYLNGAGRPSAEAPQFHPTARLEYLGYRVQFSSELGLKQGRERELRTQLLRRLHNVRATAINTAPIALAREMCEAVTKALDPTSPLSLATAERLRYGVDDRSQLKDLDYKLALMIAEAATGWRGPRAFRIVSYRQIRQMGLVSLLARRDRSRPTGAQQ